MFDEIERLRESHALLALLDHYAVPAVIDREAWQDRLMLMEGVKPSELTVLHGELLAFGWLEINAGSSEKLKSGTVPCCYRISYAGLRALRCARLPRDEDEELAEAA